MSDTSASYTQTVFPLIEHGDVEGHQPFLNADPMLVHALWQDDSVADHPNCLSALQFAADCGQLDVCKSTSGRTVLRYTPANLFEHIPTCNAGELEKTSTCCRLLPK